MQVKKIEVSIHMASQSSKNRYVNIKIHYGCCVTSSSPTSVAAQLGEDCIALLHFLGSNPGRVGFFYFITFCVL